MTKKQLDLLKNSLDREAKKLDDAIAMSRRCDRAAGVASRVVQRLSAKIEEMQLAIEEEIGGPWAG